MTTTKKTPSFNLHLLIALRKLVVPFFRSEERRKAFTLLILLLLFLCAVSGINVVLSYLGRDFMTALADKKSELFYTMLPKYLLGFAAATAIAVMYRYCEERLALAWRNWMTLHLIKKYFFSRSYYKIRMNSEIDNPDQRIAEDVKNFTATTLSLVLIVLNSFITAIAFIGVLGSISQTLVWVLISYAVLGTAGTILIGKRLVRIHNRQYRREANFRYGLVRIRDNAESIAFFKGEARERVDLIRRFRTVFRNTVNLIGWNRNLGFFTTAYNNLSLIIPTVLVAPLYFQGKVEFGVVSQAGSAFAQVLAALSVIITQFERLSAFAAGVHRLEGLWDVLNAKDLGDKEDDPEVTVEEGTELRIDALTVSPPNTDRVLVSDLSLNLPRKGALLIMGESGTGKSSILRTIAGLWNSGSGMIQRPRLRQMMFLPQRPYMPIGSLRAQLMYPGREAEGSDEKLKETLKMVNLEGILQRVDGDLSRQLDWSNILSLGEQQRVSFARLLYNEPLLAFLDEATSALDETNEKMLYELVRSRGISLVSVGHRSTLIRFHNEVLRLSSNGTWKVQNSDEALQEQENAA